MPHVKPKPTSESRKPTFFWQGLLIVLPAVVLAVAGLNSMRQDKRMVEAQAKQRAQEIADEVAEQIETALASTNDPGHGLSPRPVSFQMDQQGRLISPPPIAGLPTPEFLDPADLTPEQARLWQAARRASSDPAARDSALQVWQQFIQLKPPHRFEAVAAYSRAVLLADQGQTGAAAEALRQCGERWPEAVGETGLPLGPLATLKRLELSVAPTNRAAVSAELRAAANWLASNALAHPNLLTPFLLSRMRVMDTALGLGDRTASWQEDWEQDEQARALYAASQAHWRTNLSVSIPAPPADSTGSNLLGLVSPLPPVRVSLPRLFWIHRRPMPTAGQTNQSFAPLSVASNALPRARDLSPTEELRRSGPTSRLSMAEEDSPQMVILWSAASSGAMALQSQQDWLEVRHEQNDGTLRVVCWPAFDRGEEMIPSGQNVIQPVRSVMARAAKLLPDYFGFSLDLAGKSIFPSNALETISLAVGGKGSGQYWKKSHGSPPPIMATCTRSEAGSEYLRVAVHLTSSEMLFEEQRARQGLFGLLIVVSAGAVLAGFMVAWRAFAKQQRLSEMKSNFVSSVSHELRAPIASMRLMTENLERGKVSEPGKQREYFGFILQECRRLSALIENVLDFSRIEQGRKQYEFEPTDVVALLQATVKLMEPNATEKQVTLHLQLSTFNFQPSLDARALQQALVNLIDNAIKHSPAGETVTVQVECSAGFPAGGFPELSSSDTEGLRTGKSAEPADKNVCATLLLSVSDHGPGIPPEDYDRIFERFYRRGSELRRETQGVGIGLSIVKHIVAAHGGRVRVESMVGKGSRFVVELPLSANGRKGIDN